MFFIGIFGVQKKNEEITIINNMICESCGRMTAFKLMKMYSCFQLFFIPIFKWHVEYYFISKCCESIFTIPIEQGEAIEQGNDSVLSSLNMRVAVDRSHICRSCGKQLDEDFSFCPYCGTKLGD